MKERKHLKVVCTRSAHPNSGLYVHDGKGINTMPVRMHGRGMSMCACRAEFMIMRAYVSGRPYAVHQVTK